MDHKAWVSNDLSSMPKYYNSLRSEKKVKEKILQMKYYVLYRRKPFTVPLVLHSGQLRLGKSSIHGRRRKTNLVQKLRNEKILKPVSVLLGWQIFLYENKHMTNPYCA